MVLVGQLKGKADQSVPAVGFAMGMERLLLLLEQVEDKQKYVTVKCFCWQTCISRQSFGFGRANS
jgi:histidyl-tRNA synthetase